MPMDIAVIFTAIEVAQSIAEFAGILDSVEAKVNRLVQSELNAGLRTLEQAALGTSEQVSLLREARGCFNKAVTLEMGYRRVVALLGLSLCHHWLGDKPNCTRALEEILEINPVTTLKVITAAGRRQIRESIRESNPFTLSKRLKQRKEEMKKEIAAGKGFFQRSLSSFGRDPMIKHGKLIFSGRARKEYKRDLVLDAVDMSQEATAIRRVQESVSRHVGKPVSWLKALE